MLELKGQHAKCQFNASQVTKVRSGFYNNNIIAVEKKVKSVEF